MSTRPPPNTTANADATARRRLASGHADAGADCAVADRAVHVLVTRPSDERRFNSRVASLNRKVL